MTVQSNVNATELFAVRYVTNKSKKIKIVDRWKEAFDNFVQLGLGDTAYTYVSASWSN